MLYIGVLLGVSIIDTSAALSRHNCGEVYIVCITSMYHEHIVANICLWFRVRERLSPNTRYFPIHSKFAVGARAIVVCIKVHYVVVVHRHTTPHY